MRGRWEPNGKQTSALAISSSITSSATPTTRQNKFFEAHWKFPHRPFTCARRVKQQSRDILYVLVVAEGWRKTLIYQISIRTKLRLVCRWSHTHSATFAGCLCSAWWRWRSRCVLIKRLAYAFSQFTLLSLPTDGKLIFKKMAASLSRKCLK